MAHGLALPGSPRKHTASRKYALAAGTVVSITVPKHANAKKRAQLVKFHIPADAAVYIGWDGQEAAIPTTNADGTEQVENGDVIALWTQARLTVVAEGAATIQVTWYWVS